MMPPAEVFEIAPAKVLQGAVRLHGNVSSPTPDTQDLVCALAGAAFNRTASIVPATAPDANVFMDVLPSVSVIPGNPASHSVRPKPDHAGVKRRQELPILLSLQLRGTFEAR